MLNYNHLCHFKFSEIINGRGLGVELLLRIVITFMDCDLQGSWIKNVQIVIVYFYVIIQG